MKKLITLFLLSLSFIACKKEKYEGSQSFWFNQTTSHDLRELADVTTLTFYVDDEFVSTVDVSAYKMSTPACKEGQFLYVEKMHKKETATHTFKVVDQNNYVFWDGKFKTEASKCNLAQLSF
jgi:thioredoxin-related protein